MWTTRTRSVVIGGGAAALIAVAGTAGGLAAAHAAGSTPSPTTTATTVTSTPGGTSTAASGTQRRKHAKADAVARLKGLQHAQWVVAGTGGAFVTRDAIRGTVTAVSATSVTVKAEDGVSQTYAVTTSTKVALRAAKTAKTGGATAGPATPAAKGSITDVKSGAEVVVTGTGTTSLAADRILVPRG